MSDKGGFSFTIHSNVLLASAMKARDSAKQFLSTQPHALAVEVAGAIVLATASAEAFINELAFVLHKQDAMDWFKEKPNLKSTAQCLQFLESEHGALQVKFLIASHLLGRPFDKSRNPYQDFVTLVKLRNDLIHLKVREKPPKELEALQNRGLASKQPLNVLITWFSVLMTEKMAEWACETAHSIIVAMIDAIDDTFLTHSFSIFKANLFEKPVP